MGDLTRDDLIEEIKAGLGRAELGTDSVSTSRYVRALNLAQTRISRLANWQEMQREQIVFMDILDDPKRDIRALLWPRSMTLPSGLTSPGNHLQVGDKFPKDILNMQIMYEGRNTPVIRWPLRQYRHILPFHIPVITTESVTTGRPTVYTTYSYVDAASIQGTIAKWLYFDRAPTSAYYLHFITVNWPKEFDLVSNSVSELLHKDEAIIEYATGYMLTRFGRRADAKECFISGRQLALDSSSKDSPDADLSHRPRGISESDGARGDYWADPFVRGDGSGETW